MEGLKKDYKKRHQNDAFFVYLKSNKKMETKKSPEYLLETLFLGGLDGTRTRDLRRDRAAF